MRAVGLMSGTSLDGIDAALVEVHPRGETLALRLERFMTVPFAEPLRARLFEALPPHTVHPAALTDLDGQLGDALAAAACAVTAGETVAFIASHGLTAYHDGAGHRTLQLGDPYRLRDALNVTVVFDFRRADCAAGGHGAPLVPYVDAVLFASATRNVVALNIGGIANVTVLEADASRPVRAWDTGPGTMLLDAFVRMRTAGRSFFDAGGRFALRGRVHERIVATLVARESAYLRLAPPKSTGRERFGAQWLTLHGDLLDAISLEDGCATLCGLTAATIADSLASFGPHRPRVIASGGGVHNGALLAMLGERLALRGVELALSNDVGIDPDAKEAMAFALLGYETLRGRPANVPTATGARGPAVLGAIVPHGLPALLAQIQAESAAVQHR